MVLLEKSISQFPRPGNVTLYGKNDFADVKDSWDEEYPELFKWVLNIITSVLIKREAERDLPHREEEKAVWPQSRGWRDVVKAKECQQSPAAEEARSRFSPQASRESMALLTP